LLVYEGEFPSCHSSDSDDVTSDQFMTSRNDDVSKYLDNFNELLVTSAESDGNKPKASGDESGYSSGVDGKNKKNQDTKNQDSNKKFVSSLSRKVQMMNHKSFHPNIVDVRLIDFAHVYEQPSKTDENYIFGLQNLINHFKQILKDISN